MSHPGSLSTLALMMKLPTCSLILRSNSIRYKVRAALSSVRGSTNTVGSTSPGKNDRDTQIWHGGIERHEGGMSDKESEIKGQR